MSYEKVRGYRYQDIYGASQNYNVAECFDAFFEHLVEIGVQIETVIELGTSVGGFTLYLCDRLPDARIYSFDVCSCLYQEKMNQHPNLQFFQQDVFSEDTVKQIAALISAGGTTLFLCDDGDKIREFGLYAPFLKTGDFIMAHDYSPGQHDHDPTWPWVEIWDDAVSTVASECALSSFFFETMAKARWLSCRRA